jgi:hypothetical protein
MVTSVGKLDGGSAIKAALVVLLTDDKLEFHIFFWYYAFMCGGIRVNERFAAHTCQGGAGVTGSRDRRATLVIVWVDEAGA